MDKMSDGKYMDEVLGVYADAYASGLAAEGTKAAAKRAGREAIDGLANPEWFVWGNKEGARFRASLGTIARQANLAAASNEDVAPSVNGNGSAQNTVKAPKQSPTDLVLSYIEGGNWKVGDVVYIGNLYILAMAMGCTPSAFTYPTRERSGHAGYEWKVADSRYYTYTIEITAVPAKTVSVDIDINQYAEFQAYLKWKASQVGHN